MADFSRITHTPAETGSKASLRDPNVSATSVLGLLATGRSEEEILRMFPSLTVEDIRETLAYAARRLQEQEPKPAYTGPQAPQEVPLHLSTPSPKFLQPPKARAATEEISSLSTQSTVDSPQHLEAEQPDDSDDGRMELYHPSQPDKPTVVLSSHGLFDRRWFTGIVAWCDIRDIRRISGEKTIVITLRNPRSYLSAMPFFKRFLARIRLLLNMHSMYLDTASLGIRTKDLQDRVERLWVRHRGGRRKKRRIRIGKSNRSYFWDDYLR